MSKAQAPVSGKRKYRVLQHIWSYEHEEYFWSGSMVEFDLSKTTQDKLDTLVEKGVLEPITEADNGTNSTDGPVG